MSKSKKEWLVASIIIILVFACGVTLGHACCNFTFRQKEEFLYDLINSWDGFEARYAEDINDIDNLRSNLKSMKSERDMWEGLSYVLINENKKFEMEKNEWVNKNVGLRSKAGRKQDPFRQGENSEPIEPRDWYIEK